MRSTLTIWMTVFSLIGPVASAHAEETFGEKVREIGEDAVKGIKKGGRAADTWICETVEGEEKCTEKRARHQMRNTQDEINDKANDPRMPH